MFLWWSRKAPDESAQTAIEEEQHEIEDLKQELGSAVGLTRPSIVSKAKYNKWVVAEDNRNVGSTMREEHAGLVSQRDESRTEFLEATHERTNQTRQQREAASERVRQHRAAMQARGRNIKSQRGEAEATARTAKEQYLQYGQRNAQIYGTEQMERLRESRSERDEERRRNAMMQKQAMQDRAEQFQEATARQISERRDRVARIRHETNPEVAESSKQYFKHTRKLVADDVRESVCEWKKETQANFETALGHAKVNKQCAEETRKNAIDGKKLLVEERRRQAGEMRDSIKQIELHKEHMKLSTEYTKREGHDTTFESRFVPAEQAIAVEISSYDQIANTHREELAKRAGQPRVETGRPAWNTFFGNTHDGGFFKSGWWFPDK